MKAIVIGGGPAGLMAADRLSAGGAAVDLFDAMPSLGRKFLLAGKGGLNLTHAEPFARFMDRYGSRRDDLAPSLDRFSPEAVRRWAQGLGIETFVGSSQRVFPREMKAAPLLRAWLRRLRTGGVRTHTRHRWCGWQGDALLFETPEGPKTAVAEVVVLALGGASWPQLGADGGWVPLLRGRGVDIADLKPANCGFNVGWSPFMRQHHAGAPVKPVTATFLDERRRGEFVITETGVEGGLIYSFAATLRDAIARDGRATLLLDLAPHKTIAELARPRGKFSLSTHLRKRASIDGVRAALIRELAAPEILADDRQLAEVIKALPLVLQAPRPITEVISSAGGVRFEALDEHLMLKAAPGIFCAGEMLDWEAPTGGYLLTACLATGRTAGDGALQFLRGARRA